MDPETTQMVGALIAQAQADTNEAAAGSTALTQAKVAEWREHYRTRLAAYDYEPRDPDFFEFLAGYMAYYNGRLPRKGILLIGRPGCGKTKAMQMMKTLFGIRMFSARGLVKWYREDDSRYEEIWDPEFRHENKGRHDDVIIDDIGPEPMVNKFGTKVEVIADLIDDCWARWDRNGTKVFITTNLTMEALAKRYGNRTVSRLKGMCNIQIVKAPDGRETSNDEVLL